MDEEEVNDTGAFAAHYQVPSFAVPIFQLVVGARCHHAWGAFLENKQNKLCLFVRFVSCANMREISIIQNCKAARSNAEAEIPPGCNLLRSILMDGVQRYDGCYDGYAGY